MSVVKFRRNGETTICLIGAALIAISFVLGCSGSQPVISDEPAVEEKVEVTAEKIWGDIRELYGRAREKGEQVPGDIYEWTRQDLKGIGDWQYQVVDVAENDLEQITTLLNEQGGDRWECIFIEPLENGRRFYFKKPVKVYLKNIPLSDILKLIPAGGGSE